MSLPTRWIICTKWAVPKEEGPAGPVSQKDTTICDKSPAKPSLENKWTPLGTPQFNTRHGKHSGIPKSFATADEATTGLQETINLQPDLASQQLEFVILEVKYVPNKIKVYKQAWFDKYVVRELGLELKDHKFTDTIK